VPFTYARIRQEDRVRQNSVCDLHITIRTTSLSFFALQVSEELLPDAVKDTALWKEFVKGVKSIRASVVSAILKPRAEYSVFVAYASVRPAGEARPRGP
jgi:hypothetical protein